MGRPHKKFNQLNKIDNEKLQNLLWPKPEGGVRYQTKFLPSKDFATNITARWGRGGKT
jgi:hypothetical protein